MRKPLLCLVMLTACGDSDSRSRAIASDSSANTAGTTVSAVETSGEAGDDDSTGPDDPAPTSSSTTSPASSGPATTGADDDGPPEPETTGDPGEPSLPPADAGLDYQLGGAYPPPAGVTVVSRDRNAAPAPGLYNICYVNGYQTQPDEESWWLREHPELLLRDGNGDPFIDPDWDEILLDITTPAKRDGLAEIVGGWIEQCAADGFDAVEIDNLDTYSRSDGLISQDDAVDYISRLSSTAHASGLAIAQKNSIEIGDRREEMGTDFAVAEECNRWGECADYQAIYGDLVFVIEYRAQDFDAGCANFPELSIVFRDLDLVPPSNGAYVFDGC